MQGHHDTALPTDPHTIATTAIRINRNEKSEFIAMVWNFSRWNPVFDTVPTRPIELLPDYVSRANALLPEWTIEQYKKTALEIDTILMLSGFPFVSNEESSGYALSELHVLKLEIHKDINRPDVDDGFSGNAYQYYAVLALLFVEEVIQAITKGNMSTLMHYQGLAADAVTYAEGLFGLERQAKEKAQSNGKKSHAKTNAIKERAIAYYEAGKPWKSKAEAVRQFLKQDDDAKEKMSQERASATTSSWLKEWDDQQKKQ